MQPVCLTGLCKVLLYPPVTVPGDPKAERRILSGKGENTRNVRGWCLESELGRASECAGQRGCRSFTRAGLDMLRGAFF